MPLSFPIPNLGLGAAPLGSLTEDSTFGAVSEADAIATVQRCLELGVTFFDTAPLYGAGLSEVRLGKALQGVPRDRYVLASKTGFLVNEAGELYRDYSRDGVRRSIDASLKRLRTDYLDVAHIHDPDNHMAESLEQSFPALLELKEQGVIGAIGSGVNQAAPLIEFANHSPFDCFLLAGRYTLLEQGPLRTLFPLCREKQIGIFLAGVFNTGILATGVRPGVHYQYAPAPAEIIEKTTRIEAVCRRYDVSIAAAALQFARAHPVVSALVVGMKTPQEVDQNVASFHAKIPSAFWAELKEQELIEQDAPTPTA